MYVDLSDKFPSTPQLHSMIGTGAMGQYWTQQYILACLCLRNGVSGHPTQSTPVQPCDRRSALWHTFSEEVAWGAQTHVHIAEKNPKVSKPGFLQTKTLCYQDTVQKRQDFPSGILSKWGSPYRVIEFTQATMMSLLSPFYSPFIKSSTYTKKNPSKEKQTKKNPTNNLFIKTCTHIQKYIFDRCSIFPRKKRKPISAEKFVTGLNLWCSFLLPCDKALPVLRLEIAQFSPVPTLLSHIPVLSPWPQTRSPGSFHPPDKSAGDLACSPHPQRLGNPPRCKSAAHLSITPVMKISAPNSAKKEHTIAEGVEARAQTPLCLPQPVATTVVGHVPVPPHLLSIDSCVPLTQANRKRDLTLWQEDICREQQPTTGKLPSAKGLLPCRQRLRQDLGRQGSWFWLLCVILKLFYPGTGKNWVKKAEEK